MRVRSAAQLAFLDQLAQGIVDWESAFLRELRHFHECIVAGTENRTALASARHDIGLILDIIGKYRE